MEPSFATMLQQYETLVNEDVDMDRQYDALGIAKKKNKRKIEGVKLFLQTGLDDPQVRAEYRRIGQIKKSSSGNQASGKTGPSKTDILLEGLQKYGEGGLILDEIMELLEPYGLNVDRNVVCTMLNRLKTKRRLVAKEGKKYFLTELGKNMKLENRTPE